MLSILIATIGCIILRRLTILVCGTSGLAMVLLCTAWIARQLAVIGCTVIMIALSLTWLLFSRILGRSLVE